MRHFLGAWQDEFRLLFMRTDREASSTGLTIGEVAGLLYARWRTVTIFALTGMLVALTVALSTPPRYSATVLVGLSDAGNTENASSSGISSLLRFTGASGTLDPGFQSFLLLLTSNKVASRLEQQYHLLRKIHGDEWDESTQSWRAPEGPVFAAKQGLKRILRMAPWSKPDSTDLASFIRENLTTTETIVPNVERVTLEYGDQNSVGVLLKSIIQDANDIMRDTEERNAKNSEGYLLQKLDASTTTSVDQRQALRELLLQEEQRLLLVNMRENYIGAPMDDIVVSKGPIWPQTGLFVVFGTLLGAILGALIILLRG